MVGREIRHTDAISVYPLHQDEARKSVEHHAGSRFHEWRAQQPVLLPRYAGYRAHPPTQPKLRFNNGHIQHVLPQVGPYQPPRARNTDGIPRLPSPTTPIPEAPKPTRTNKLSVDALPGWLVELLNERKKAKQEAQVKANDADLDALARAFSRMLPDPGPMDEQVKMAISHSQPLDANSWVTATLPALRPLDANALASSDKIVSNPLGVTQEDCAPTLDTGELTEIREAVRERRSLEEILKQMRESEK